MKKKGEKLPDDELYHIYIIYIYHIYLCIMYIVILIFVQVLTI